jgi:hypothetical protein
MEIKATFRKIIGKPPKTFKEVNQMTTRAFSVPSLKDPFVRLWFTANLGKDGLWRISVSSNDMLYAGRSEAVRQCRIAASNALAHYRSPGELPGKGVSFDTVYFTMRELEETYVGSRTSGSAYDHYSRAYSLLPKALQESLTEIYQQRRAGKPSIIPPKKTP